MNAEKEFYVSMSVSTTVFETTVLATDKTDAVEKARQELVASNPKLERKKISGYKVYEI